jgi:hypothetical protein
VVHPYELARAVFDATRFAGATSFAARGLA